MKKTAKKKFDLRASLKDFLTARNTRLGAVSVTITVLFVAAVVLLNFVVNSLSSRHSLYLDVTADSYYDLRTETEEFLSSLKKDVTISILTNETVFESYGDYYVQANKLVHRIDNASSHISLNYIDLTTNPTFTADYPDVTWNESHLALVTCGSEYRVIDAEDFFDYSYDSTYDEYIIEDQHIEQAFATAILNVSSEEKVVVTVLTGLGGEDATPLTSRLENNVFEIEEVNLTIGSISEDSRFVVIYVPDVDIDDDMLSTLTAWLENNGKYGHNLIYFPTDKRDLNQFPNLNALIADWGMEMSYGYVYESDPSYISATLNSPLCSLYTYSDSTFTEGLRNKDLPVFLYYTMPVEITDSNIASPMLNSSDYAIFTPMLAKDRENYDPVVKSYCGAAYGTKSGGTLDGKSSHVVVIGSYDALSEGFLKRSTFNNSSYFINMFNVLADRDDMGFIIDGKNLDADVIGIKDMATRNFLSILVRFVIPGLVLIAGLIVWIRRRHR